MKWRHARGNCGPESTLQIPLQNDRIPRQRRCENSHAAGTRRNSCPTGAAIDIDHGEIDGQIVEDHAPFGPAREQPPRSISLSQAMTDPRCSGRNDSRAIMSGPCPSLFALVPRPRVHLVRYHGATRGSRGIAAAKRKSRLEGGGRRTPCPGGGPLDGVRGMGLRGEPQLAEGHRARAARGGEG